MQSYVLIDCLVISQFYCTNLKVRNYCFFMKYFANVKQTPEKNIIANPKKNEANRTIIKEMNEYI